MIGLYTTAIRCYGTGIKVAQHFSNKASLWVKGRQQLFSNLEEAIGSHKNWVWFHVASLGEFEQGRPLIEKIKSEHPNTQILLTFFSPSGYTIRKNYNNADFVTYIPLDTPENAIKFVRIARPRLAIFVKYELWFHHLNELRIENIPTVLISAQFRAGQFYFKSYGSFFLPLLQSLQKIFVVDAVSKELLEKHGFQNMVQSGDTRIDRVLQVASSHRDFGFILNALGNDFIIVAGSTWPEDEKHLLPLINSKGFKCVIAPHEINEGRLQSLERDISGRSIRLSQLTDNENLNLDVLIVDTMGDLTDIYHIANCAYVGGGFGSGIHNILEPVAHNIPVLFGPNYQRFIEASELIELGICHSVETTEELESAILQSSDQEFAIEVSGKAKEYMAKHKGATTQIYEYIRRERLLEDGLDSNIS